MFNPVACQLLRRDKHPMPLNEAHYIFNHRPLLLIVITFPQNLPVSRDHLASNPTVAGGLAPKRPPTRSWYTNTWPISEASALSCLATVTAGDCPAEGCDVAEDASAFAASPGESTVIPCLAINRLHSNCVTMSPAPVGTVTVCRKGC